jgi:hypothetical protein
MATFKAIVFQTGRHIKQDGTSNIKIRIYHNRESQYIATSYYRLSLKPWGIALKFLFLHHENILFPND